MKAMFAARLLAVALAVLAVAPAFGQGVQTGVLTGTVTDQDGLVAWRFGYRVVAGPAGHADDGHGRQRRLRRGADCPRGSTLRFELSGMRTVEATQRVDPGSTARVDARLQLDTLTETVTVTAELPTMVTSVAVSANYRGEMIDKLASPRTVQGVAELAPASPTTRRTPAR